MLLSAGAGLQALVRSLISETTAPKNISVVFSVGTLLTIAGGALAGPIYSASYAAGLRSGSGLIGLPFVVAGAMLAVVFCMAVLVREARLGHFPEQAEQREEGS